MLKEKFNSNKSNSIQSEGCSKCQCSLTNKSYLKQKNIIIQNPFNKRTKLLKNYNTKSNINNISKTSREKEILKNKIYNQPYKNNK